MTQPNLNFLSQLGFRLVIQRLPEVEYFIQKINIPGLTLPPATRSTPFISPVPYPASAIQFNDLTVSFKVDEELKNYLSIWNWMIDLGFPQLFDQYKKLAGDTTHKPLSSFEEGAVTDNIKLVLLDNKHNSKFEFDFTSCWPTSISDLNLESTAAGVSYITADVTFKYHYYTIGPNSDAVW